MLRGSGLQSAELCHETVANLILVNGSCCYLFWSKILSLQAEALHPLQNGENPQAHHKAVCGIGSRSQFKDGTYATPL